MIKKDTVTIASGAAVSDAFEVREGMFVMLQMPSTWTAASLGFKVATEKGGTYLPLYDEYGNLLALTVAASTTIRVPVTWLAGCPWVKLWSETAGADVAQGGARAITIVCSWN